MRWEALIPTRCRTGSLTGNSKLLPPLLARLTAPRTPKGSDWRALPAASEPLPAQARQPARCPPGTNTRSRNHLSPSPSAPPAPLLSSPRRQRGPGYAAGIAPFGPGCPSHRDTAPPGGRGSRAPWRAGEGRQRTARGPWGGSWPPFCRLGGAHGAPGVGFLWRGTSNISKYKLICIYVRTHTCTYILPQGAVSPSSTSCQPNGSMEPG